MARDRAERIALIEAAFRIANERMASWEERSPGGVELYFCECAKLDCREKVSLTRAQYEAVRARPEHFVIVPGHDVPDAEDVVEDGDGHAVVEKPDSVMDLVRATDPRTDTPGPGREEADAIADEIAPELPEPPQPRA
jgi:hypothetical protein